ncbi:VOC family protein [uncultured Meiothermus sp.]|jgi:hypothetical protein|uniref:VOC family protein n=1 Tax=uncultured Meiothermus sp. TaxID=157471 RepID=UPI00262C65C5|nr:VOC family protein [uncultured Meiothermus sp.]
MTRLDHIVVAAETLEQGLEYVQTTLAVELPPAGGKHPLMGTHNRLLNLGNGVYLEIIAIDPEALAPGRPRWFGLDRFVGGPRLLTWVARTGALERYQSLELGTVSKASRGDLEWLIAIPEDGRLHLGGAVPYLIQWGQNHPTDTLPDVGCRLVELMILHPQPEQVGQVLQKLGLENLRLKRSERPELMASVQTPGGLKVLR